MTKGTHNISRTGTILPTYALDNLEGTVHSGLVKFLASRGLETNLNDLERNVDKGLNINEGLLY